MKWTIFMWHALFRFLQDHPGQERQQHSSDKSNRCTLKTLNYITMHRILKKAK